MGWYYTRLDDLDHSKRLRNWSRYYKHDTSVTLAGQFHIHLEETAAHIDILEQRLTAIETQLETLHQGVEKSKQAFAWQPSCECGKYQDITFRGIVCERCGTKVLMLNEFLERPQDGPLVDNVMTLLHSVE